MMKGKNVLVISAHAADYVWRAGGTIARYLNEGARVKVIALSLGIRGESNDLWKMGYCEEQVRSVRLSETTKAAGILGIQEFECWQVADYPLAPTTELTDRLLREIRHFRPEIILTHDRYDVLNPDHNCVSDMVYRCAIMSNSAGIPVEELPATKQMALFGFEPHQTELSRFTPGCFIDVTPTFGQKVEAMQCFQAQKHLIQYYMDRGSLRGNHARRLSGDQSIRYAESFAAFFPYVSDEFVVRGG